MDFLRWNGVAPWHWPHVAGALPRARKTPFLKRQRLGGRPRLDDRLAFSAILWHVRTGGAWRRLPKAFGSSATARRRLAHWSRGPWLGRAWRAYLEQVSGSELSAWGACLNAAALRQQLFWRIELETIYRLEFSRRA